MNTIVGIGTDLVELSRLERVYQKHGQKFLDRICRPNEVKKRSGWTLVQHLGGLFAAKEAVLKSLGTGWSEGLGFRQIEVVGSPMGGPTVRLHGPAKLRAETLGVRSIHLSITHEHHYALAFAIAERSDKND